jgi:hypothetical protein
MKLADNDNSSLVKVTKVAGEFKVEISFVSRAPENYGEDQDQMAEGDEEFGQGGTFVDFLVAVNRKNENAGFIYECTAMDAALHVNNIVYSMDIANAEGKLNGMNRTLYRGPDFVTLEDEL